MRLTIARKALVDLVSCGTATAPKTAIAPIVTHARLRADPRFGLLIASTDLDKIVEARADADVQARGALTVDADKFKTTVDRLKGDEVSLALDEKRDLILKCGKSRVRFATLAAEDWPTWDWEISGASFETSGAQLSRLLTIPLLAAGLGGVNPIYESVFIHAREWSEAPSLAATATNGHVLLVTTIGRPEGADSLPDNGGRPGVLLSVETARLALRLFAGEEKVLIAADRNKVSFEGAGARLSSKLVEGVYPHYEGIIPGESETSILLDRQRAVSAVSLIETFATKDRGRKLQCAGSDEGFVMAAGDMEAGDATDVADAEITGVVKPFGLSSEYLKLMLGAFKSETLRLDYFDPSKPLRLSTEAEADMVGVLSTMRINTNLVASPGHE